MSAQLWSQFVSAMGPMLAFVGVTACTEVLDLDIAFVDEPGTGGAGGQADSASSVGAGVDADCTMDVAVASDSFTYGDESGWCKLTPEPSDEIFFANQGVTLHVVDSAWYDDSLGPFLYRSIAKDQNFAVVTRLDVTGGDGLDVAEHRHGAGLLVRAPNPPPSAGQENWVKLSVGYTSPNGRGAAWSATNQDETTEPNHYLHGSFKAVAICRLDTIFYFFAYRHPDWVPVPTSGAEATQHRALTDAEHIQVGVVAHAAPTKPGAVMATARYIDFISVETTCMDALPASPLMSN